MKVVGFDPGLGVTGFGIMEQSDNKITTICYGTIRAQSNKKISQRLKHIYKEASKLLQTYKPDIVAIEDTFYQKNVKSALALGQAKGVLLLAAANENIECVEYAPRKVKQSITGNGAATKEQVQFMVQQILKLEKPPTPIDTSDALAIGLCYINQLG